jgi:hypothetical protein
MGFCVKLRPKTVIVIAALGLAALSGCSTSEPASEAISGKRAIAAPRAGTPTSRPATDLTTHTGQDVPCEPINVALVGTRKEITRAFQTIGWRQPHSINPLSSLAMAFSVVLYLPYGQAAMTRLYFDGR